MSVTSDQWVNRWTWGRQQMNNSCFDMSLKILKYVLIGVTIILCSMPYSFYKTDLLKVYFSLYFGIV
jgi:hypothetical protein